MAAETPEDSQTASAATPSIEETSSEPSAVPSLGTRSLRGAFWTTLFSLATKFVTLASQIVLAWFLIPEDIGLVAQALSITMMFEWLTAGGLQDVLVQRREGFNRNASQVFYLFILANTVAAGLAIGAAPLGGVVFRDARVVPLIMLAAGAWPVGSLAITYKAKLSRELRFRTIAAIFFGVGVIRMGGAVPLAALGFGAYSIVLPIYAGHIYCAIALRLAAGPIPFRRPAPREWPALLSPAFWLMLYGLFTQTRVYGTNLVVGIVHQAAVTGLYFWGFQLSGQTIKLLASNLREVLFPTLALLTHDRERQYAGFTVACRVGLLVATPLCLLQALTARPLIHLLFPERWWGAAPVVIWLSLGMLTQPFNALAEALLRARGVFRLLALLLGAQVVALLAMSVVGALLGKQESVAAWAGSSEFVVGLVAGWLAFRQFGRGWREVGAIIVPQLGVAAVSGCVGWLVAVQSEPAGPIGQLAATVAATGVVYIVLVALFLRQRARELLIRLPRFRRRSGND